MQREMGPKKWLRGNVYSTVKAALSWTKIIFEPTSIIISDHIKLFPFYNNNLVGLDISWRWLLFGG